MDESKEEFRESGRALGRIALGICTIAGLILAILMLIYRKDEDMLMFLAGGATICVIYILYYLCLAYVLRRPHNYDFEKELNRTEKERTLL